MKIDGSEVRAGMVVEYNNKLWLVTRHQIVAPGNWRAFNQVELKDLRTGSKSNERLSSSEKVERVTLSQKEYQFLFADGDMLTFMDNENYEQISVQSDLLGEQRPFLKDGMNVTIETHDGQILNVKLPDKIEMEIVEADPVVKGQTAASSYKPAILSNGVKVMVPPFIETGTRIVVNMVDLSYVERAKQS